MSHMPTSSKPDWSHGCRVWVTLLQGEALQEETPNMGEESRSLSQPVYRGEGERRDPFTAQFFLHILVIVLHQELPHDFAFLMAA